MRWRIGDNTKQFGAKRVKKKNSQEGGNGNNISLIGF